MHITSVSVSGILVNCGNSWGYDSLSENIADSVLVAVWLIYQQNL